MPLFDPYYADNIPQAMREVNQWVVWRFETKKGKPAKVPMSALTGRRASSTDKKTWTSFAKALEALKSKPDWGLGFVLQPPWVGIDLDHCTEDDVLSEAARQVVARLACTYAEWSPSGEGIHILLKGELAQAHKSARGEIYTSGRYFTVTGQKLDSNLQEIIEVYKETLDWVIEYIEGEGAFAAGGTPANPADLDINTDDTGEVPYTLIDSLIESNPQARLTWQRKRGFSSDSEYEMSLARICVHADWEDQDIFKALKTWRKKHHLPEKHHKAVVLTIAKAHSEESSVQVDAILDNPQEVPEDTQKATINQLFQLEPERLVQFGKNPASFILHLQDSSPIRFAKGDDVLLQKTWARILYEHRGRVWAQMNMKKWQKALQIFTNLYLHVEESPETTERAETEEWLDDYLRNVRYGEPDYQAVVDGNPFVCGSTTYLFLNSLLRHVNISFQAHIDRKSLASRLKVLGWENQRVKRTDERDSSKKVDRACWCRQRYEQDRDTKD